MASLLVFALLACSAWLILVTGHGSLLDLLWLVPYALLVAVFLEPLYVMSKPKSGTVRRSVEPELVGALILMGGTAFAAIVVLRILGENTLHVVWILPVWVVIVRIGLVSYGSLVNRLHHTVGQAVATGVVVMTVFLALAYWELLRMDRGRTIVVSIGGVPVPLVFLCVAGAGVGLSHCTLGPALDYLGRRRVRVALSDASNVAPVKPNGQRVTGIRL